MDGFGGMQGPWATPIALSILVALLVGWVAGDAVFAEEAGGISAAAQIEPSPPAGDADHPPRYWSPTLLVLAAGYCLMIVAASLIGGWLPFWVNLTHTQMQVMLSFVGGLMLGIGIFHMLPHAMAEMGHIDGAVNVVVVWLMAGLLTMFFLIRAFHFHQHGPVEMIDPETEGRRHSHDSDHGRGGHHHGHHAPSGRFAWVGVVFGLALHTFIDGLALAASLQAEAGDSRHMALFGLGTFLAILLHKPLDAVSITALMTASGWSPRWKHLVNAGFALMCPLGTALFFVGLANLSVDQGYFVGCALAFAAGVFLCISLGDLLPELEFHAHDRVKLSIALLLGVALAYGIGYLEPEHAHSHRSGGATVEYSSVDPISPSARTVLPCETVPKPV